MIQPVPMATTEPDDAPVPRGLLAEGRAYLARLWRFGRRRLAAAIVLVVAATALDGVGILFLLTIVRLLIADPAAGGMGASEISLLGVHVSLLAALALFALVSLLRSAMLAGRDICLGELAIGYVDYWRQRCFGALAAAAWRDVSGFNRAHLENTLQMDTMRIGQGTRLTLLGMSAVLMLMVQLGIAFWLAPRLTAAVTVLMIAATWLLRPLILRARQNGDKQSKTSRRSLEVVSHFLSGLKLAKVHHAEADYVASYGTALAANRSHHAAFIRQQAISNYGPQFLVALIAATTVYVGIEMMRLDLATLTVVLVILMRLSSPAITLVQGIQAFANILPAFANLERLVAGASRSVRPVASSGDEDASGPAHVELHDIGFAHASAPGQVLTGASCVIPAGEIVMVTGASGAGKTTLIDLVAGLVAPDRGTVLIDGQPLGAGARWPGRLSYIPQEPFLQDASIRVNLRWLDRESSDDALWRALDLAGAGGIVRALPAGLDTRVGDRGSRLSGGERQRICLARALLGGPRLLVLDEATSALDVDTERAILAGLVELRGQCTIIIVTHRPQAVPYWDQWLRLEDGRLWSDRPAPAPVPAQLRPVAG